MRQRPLVAGQVVAGGERRAARRAPSGRRRGRRPPPVRSSGRQRGSRFARAGHSRPGRPRRPGRAPRLPCGGSGVAAGDDGRGVARAPCGRRTGRAPGGRTGGGGAWAGRRRADNDHGRVARATGVSGHGGQCACRGARWRPSQGRAPSTDWPASTSVGAVQPRPSTLRPAAEVSFWLETSGDDLTPRQSLDGSAEADVAILGAGYTGLWTAYYLLRRDPSLRVVVVGGRGRRLRGVRAERSVVRTGPEHLDGPAREAARPRRGPPDATGDVRRGRRGGPGRRGRGDRRRLVPGRSSSWSRADRTRSRRSRRRTASTRRSGSPTATGCSMPTGRRAGADRRCGPRADDAGCGGHPSWAAGARAGATGRAARRDGSWSTPVTSWTQRQHGAGGRAVLRTPTGDIHADTLVLAGEAYLTRFRSLHRQHGPGLLADRADRAPDRGQWAEIGWADRACLASTRLSVDYLSRTEDGRILFGGRGAPYRFGSPIRDATTTATTRPTRCCAGCSGAGSRRSATSASPTPGAGRWGCPVTGIRRSPSTRAPASRRPRLHRARRVDREPRRPDAGRADPRRGDRTDDAPAGEPPLPVWEPEPFRWIGVRYAQWALGRIDAQAERTQRPPSGPSLAMWMARH